MTQFKREKHKHTQLKLSKEFCRRFLTLWINQQHKEKKSSQSLKSKTHLLKTTSLTNSVKRTRFSGTQNWRSVTPPSKPGAWASWRTSTRSGQSCSTPRLPSKSQNSNQRFPKTRHLHRRQLDNRTWL